MSQASSRAASVILILSDPPPEVVEHVSSVDASNHPAAELFSHILVPQICAERKSQYTSPQSSRIVPKIDEIIGECEYGGHLWYFTRFERGIASRHPSFVLEWWFPDLLETYRSSVVAGTLAPFDSNATYIHPLARINPESLSTESTRPSSLSVPSDGSVLSPSSWDDDDDSEDESSDLDEIGSSDDDLPHKRVTRQSDKRRKPEQLPFSPRKTRQIVLNVNEEDGGSGVKRTIKSRQLKLRFKYTRHRGDDTDDGEDEEDEYEGGRRNRHTSKNGGKGKSSKQLKRLEPQYGCVRSVDDIDSDFFSDDESYPLRQHRKFCEKCHEKPSNVQLAAWKKRKGRKKRINEDEEDEEDRFERLGGWMQCLKCCVSTHWGCMGNQRDDILKAIRKREVAKWKEGHPDEVIGVPPRKELGIQEMTYFVCGACSKGGICMGCMEAAVKAATNATPPPPPVKDSEDIIMADGTQEAESSKQNPVDLSNTSSRELLFRCLTCKRLAHYSHLPIPSSLPESTPLPQIAEYYQFNTVWLCADCHSYRYPLDKIIAWRPYPPDALEPSRKDQVPNYKEHLPREYLVKWQDRSYRRLNWVPHMWIVSTNVGKLKNFLSGGTKIDLLGEPVQDGIDNEEKEKDIEFEVGAGESAGDSGVEQSRAPSVGLGMRDALPDAERYIPPAWKTVDRILDVVIWAPKPKSLSKKNKHANKRQIVTSDEEKDEEEMKEFKQMVFEKGELNSLENTMTAEQWEERNGETISMRLMERVVWAFIKWDDLGYDEASWDSPPRSGESGYDAFKRAFGRYVFSRTVEIPKLSAAHVKQFDNRVKDDYRKKHLLKDSTDLKLGQPSHLKLMDFQLDGFNWLCNNWWNHQPCILADDMGLGKTVQAATFLGFIAKNFKALPALIVVPNSTITNWVRELERWAPELRVVPFYGEKKARNVIKSFELFHGSHLTTNTPAKFHVLVTTYENITGRDFTTVFKRQDRWEVLIVDEGQRLKNDASLLFRKLNELKISHRVIMTGTPLNNNIRELFNLMNFLDPKEWSDLDSLEKEYEIINEESIKELHNRLRPYFLRRIKSEVLKLPSKNEVIVPVSMTPLQKEVIQSIYTHNFNILNGLTTKSLGNVKGKLNNVLMHMRKCLQHPYLYSQDIEPKGFSSKEEEHEKLIHGSAKLRLLKSLLPQLKERGHRVLLFSQFVIALDIIEDFLRGEKFSYLRLDGGTKGTERQKGMDEFNRPGSDVFIYLLTTRAGGVGINLFSADTVIIFDPDFNPHQDLQAISRAYRYGQQKTCLVFKLMVKDSPEDRIMQIGKKKLVLDHLIVQKMDQNDDEAGEDIQSILTYGAQKLFDESDNTRDITYSDQDILKLIEKTEVEGDQEDKPKEGQAFPFAKIWAADRDSLEEIEDNDQVDSWALTLKQIENERAKDVAQAEAKSGRGHRRAAAAAKRKMGTDESQEGSQTVKKQKMGKEAPGSDTSGSVYSEAGDADDSSDSNVPEGDIDTDLPRPPPQFQRVHPINDLELGVMHQPNSRPVLEECGLCGTRHGPGQCMMTHSSVNLRDYREMLILHTDDESWELRSAAIRNIDEELFTRGHLSLIAGQPLHPMKPRPMIPKSNRSTPANRAAPAQPVQQQAGNPNLHRILNRLMKKPQPQPPTMPFSSEPAPVPASMISTPTRPPVVEPIQREIKHANSDTRCPICQSSPFHLARNCPALAKLDTKSLLQQIEHLERTEGNADVVAALQRLLKKMLDEKIDRLL